MYTCLLIKLTKRRFKNQFIINTNYKFKEKENFLKMSTTEQTVVRIKELNLDMIQPSTKNMYKPDQGGSKIVVIG